MDNAVYVPRNAKVMQYVKQCECVDATASTGRLSVKVTPTDPEPFTRHLDIRVTMVDVTCDVCSTPFRREIVEWVPGTEEAEAHGMRQVRGRIFWDRVVLANLFIPEEPGVRFPEGGETVLVRGLRKGEEYAKLTDDLGGGVGD